MTRRGCGREERGQVRICSFAGELHFETLPRLYPLINVSENGLVDPA